MTNKLTIDEREEVAKDAVDNMSEKHIELWKQRLAKHYKSFDAYCNSCGKIWELTCTKDALAIIMKKHPLTGPPTQLSPQGSIVCTCKACLERYGE